MQFYLFGTYQMSISSCQRGAYFKMATKLVDTRLAAWFSSRIQISLLDVHAGPAGKNEQLFSEATVSFWKANFKMGKNGKQKQRLLLTWHDSSNFSSQSWLQQTNGKQKAHNGKKKKEAL